ncbi:AAA family ATPase [Paenibacillus sp. IITD108]|uniref:AAA family ATPase n=1 Tax=Paenibacillus sp. IITD108 TaxID=3116649 RepID=UPI002F42335D
MNSRKIGLTLGKYAPLHRGHQHVIETAMAEMDEVIVIIYDCPETTDIPLPVRASWIRKLYPAVRVIEAWDGPSEVGDTPEIKSMQEQYVLRILNGCLITHFYCSEFYGEHMSEALGAVNRLVDPDRVQFPVSGTKVRKAPYQSRTFLHPVVYRDLAANIVFLGAPSTGKTTLAAHMADLHQTVWMPEYGREYWEQHHVERRLSQAQLVELAEIHLAREEGLLHKANHYLFVDTNAITTYMFSKSYHGEALPRLSQLADDASKRYDLVFVCGDDIPYEDTWDRSGAVERQIFQKQIIADLKCRKIPYFYLSGNLEERAGRVNEILRKFKKYRSLEEWL